MSNQFQLFDTGPPDLLRLEAHAYRQGFSAVAGIDEAGRGALAGPVVAAVVLLPQHLHIPGVDDSKKLTPAKRDVLFEIITAQAVCYSIGICEAHVIDRINILQATRQAMLHAVQALRCQPDYLLIDGITPIETPIRQQTVISGDSLSLSIAAASIIAKVTRDRMMCELDTLYPGFGLAQHKGYGAASHRDAIRRLGPTPIHRCTFRGVREYLSSTTGVS